MFNLVSRISILGALLIVGGVAALAVAACGGDAEPETIVQTVIVEKQLPGQTITERVVETVIVEKQLPGEVVTERVIETVVVEKIVEGKTVMEIQTVVVERPVTVTERVVETVVVEKIVEGKTVTEIQTVVVKEQEVITVVATATPGAPSGLARPAPGTVLRAAVNDVGSANFLSPERFTPTTTGNHEMSVFETMIIQEGTQGGLVNVASSAGSLTALYSGRSCTHAWNSTRDGDRPRPMTGNTAGSGPRKRERLILPEQPFATSGRSGGHRRFDVRSHSQEAEPSTSAGLSYSALICTARALWRRWATTGPIRMLSAPARTNSRKSLRMTRSP